MEPVMPSTGWGVLHLYYRVDRERAQFVKRHFQRDVADVHNFDLVMNASRLSPSLCAGIAVQSLHAMQDAAQSAARAGKFASIR